MPAVARRSALLTLGLAAVAALTGCASVTATAVAPVSGTRSIKINILRAAAVPIAPRTKAPALANSGTAWPKVVGSLLTYGQWLLANPNPGLAGAITVPGCAAANGLTAELQAFAADSASVRPSAPVLTSVSGPVGAVGGQVVVDVRAVRGAEPVYDRTQRGSTIHVISDRPAVAPTALSLGLIRDAAGRWRFCTVTDYWNPDTDALSALL